MLALRYVKKGMLWSCMLAVAAAGVQAQDGVVLIDQSRAMAGNVTPGDTPGFPVTLSQPGNYRLTGNLTVADGDTSVIQIVSDSVTLDLNGFTISGPALCTAGPATTCPAIGKGIGVVADGDLNTAPKGVKIHNGSVRGMGLGIKMTGDGSFVEKVNAYRNAGGGITVAGSVVDSSASHNGQFGIIGTIVRGSSARGNLGDGILTDAGGLVTGNISSENGGYGIVVFFGTASGNSMFVNKGSGLFANCPSTVIGNTISSVDQHNIETTGNGCVVVNNAVRQ